MNTECNVNSISTDSILRICDCCGRQDVEEQMVDYGNEILCEHCAYEEEDDDDE